MEMMAGYDPDAFLTDETSAWFTQISQELVRHLIVEQRFVIGDDQLSGPTARHILACVPLHHVPSTSQSPSSSPLWPTAHTYRSPRDLKNRIPDAAAFRDLNYPPETRACTLHLLALAPPLPNPQLQK